MGPTHPAPSVALEETDWVVTAFAAEEDSGLPFATILGRNHDDSYPELSDGDRHHRRRTEVLLEAAVSSKIERHYLNVVPLSKPSPCRTALHGDKEVTGRTDGGAAAGGAGGVWERLRWHV